MEISEYFVYFGIFITQSWSKRPVQIAKAEFSEVQIKIGPLCQAVHGNTEIEPQLRSFYRTAIDSASQSYCDSLADLICKTSNERPGNLPHFGGPPFPIQRLHDLAEKYS